ncbi:MAG: hypothetical protein FWD28_10295 [Treponema sp.]|nr:hypothetical protein [Treponema sp.]
MKWFFALFVFVNFNIYSQNVFQAENYQWGASIETIKINEGLPDYEELQGIQNLIYRNRVINGYNADIKYIFYENKLYAVDYILKGNYSLDDWITIYVDIENEINLLYDIDFFNDYLLFEDTRNRIMQVYFRFYGQNITANAFINDSIVEGYVFAALFRRIWEHNNTGIEMDFCYLDWSNIFEIKIRYKSPDFDIYLKNYTGSELFNIKIISPIN